MKRSMNQSGFSLVELMVVVAIIGVLATVAIPKVSHFIAKSRTTEAQVGLSTLYTYNKNFFVEFTGYTPSFYAMGYLPEGQMRYNIGFATAALNNSAYNQLRGIQPSAVAAPTLTPPAAYAGGPGTNSTLGACLNANTVCGILQGATAANPPAVPAVAVVTANNFTAAAVANIANTIVDTWTIDDSKTLKQTADGT